MRLPSRFRLQPSRRLALAACAAALLPLPALASQLTCALEQGGDERVLVLSPDADALAGSWAQMGKFKVRALLAAPAARAPRLLVEVYARAADGDYRLLSSQKASPPFATGHVEVVEPGLGRSLRYQCGEAE